MSAHCCAYVHALADTSVNTVGAHLHLIHRTVKVRVHIMHVNFNFPLKLEPKVGLHVIHDCIL